jgi:RsiW-degrading membrane proteinase PrsW (M82 family)
MGLLRTLGYVLAAALILGVVFAAGLLAAMSAFGIGVVRSDVVTYLPVLYMVLIPPLAVLFAYRRAARARPERDR